jgi:hypothetical protein
MGRRYTEAKHFQRVTAWAEICQTSGPDAGRLAQLSPAVRPVRQECAECATDCKRIGDMEACARARRACAKECRQTASRAVVA